MVVTPSSILRSATHGLYVDLSSNEGSKEVLEDSKEVLVAKKRVSTSDEHDGGECETEATGMSLALIRSSLFFLFFFFFFGNFLV